MLLRPARKDDARELAKLVHFASEGLAFYFWSQSAAPGQDPFEIGEERARREEGSFTYRNATVIEADGRAVAALVGYREPDHFPDDLDSVPPIVRSLEELERMVPGSWYVNVLAAFPEHRGKGFGSRLLLEAETIARAQKASGMSLIAAEENAGAVRLYERTGYRGVARRTIAQYPGCTKRGDWLLMTKAL